MLCATRDVNATNRSPLRRPIPAAAPSGTLPWSLAGASSGRHDRFVAPPAIGDLLERDAHLEALRAAQAGGGRLVLIAAEAGGGKTALVRAFCANARARILSGACDPLFTPRPLGPFADIAAELGGELAGAVDEGARAHDVLAVLLVELRSRPTVLVLEDLHWADEATLDVLRLLGRRVGGTRSLVVVTYRDDELGPRDPLRLVIGGLVSTPGVERLKLPPLSPDAVHELVANRDVDATATASSVTPRASPASPSPDRAPWASTT
jgi:predicted ATPase